MFYLIKTQQPEKKLILKIIKIFLIQIKLVLNHYFYKIFKKM